MQGYWSDQITKCAPSIVPDAESSQEYNIFLDTTNSNALTGKDSSGGLHLIGGGGSGFNLLQATATAGSSYQNNVLIGANVLYMTADGDIFNAPDEYSFDSVTGTITFVQAMLGGEKLNINYTP